MSSSLLNALINPLSVLTRSLDNATGYANGFVDGQRVQARFDRHSHKADRCYENDRGRGGSRGKDDCNFFGGGYGNFGGLCGLGGDDGYGDYGDYGYHRGGHDGWPGSQGGNRGSHGHQGAYGSFGAYGSHGSHGHGSSHGHAGNVTGHRNSGHANQVKPLALQRNGNDATVTTSGGYKIAGVAGGDEGGSMEITSPDGKKTKIWGDPHVSVDGVDKFDFTDSGFTVGLKDGTKLEIATRKLANGTSVIDKANVIDANGNSGVRFSNVSSGKGGLVVNQGNGKVLDRQIEDGIFALWDPDNGYVAPNDFGGFDQGINSDAIRGWESGANQQEDVRFTRGQWRVV